MIDNFIHLKRIKDKAEFDVLVEQAKHDGHGAYVPTHVLWKGDKRVGYFSVGSPGVPVVFAWLSTKDVSPRESFNLINLIENHVALGGAVAVSFPVPKDSPFHEIMVNMGYSFAGNYDFFVKKLVED